MDADEKQAICAICGKPLYPSDEGWTLVSHADAGEAGEPNLETQEVISVAHRACWERENQAEFQ
jgi:hypothetical protein